MMVHAPAPEHAPVHPEKMLLLEGVSVSVTWVFGGKLEEHVVPQLIPAGVLVTVPVPVPARVTVIPLPALKRALTVAAAARVMVQAPVPEHAPVHPEKMLLLEGVSVSVTWVFGGKLEEHVVPQLIPAGALVTVPVPVPARVTVIPLPALKRALTVAAAVRVMVQMPVPVQFPFQPPKK
jgi:hypothetical protein